MERLVTRIRREDVPRVANDGLWPISGDPRVVNALLAALKNDDYDVRTVATTILPTSSDPLSVNR